MEQINNIITSIDGFIAKNGSYYSEFYVGIASDPINRLTSGHGLDGTIPHIYTTKPIFSEMVREMEKHFLGKGCRGGAGGGDDKTTFLYVYKMTNRTRQ